MKSVFYFYLPPEENEKFRNLAELTGLRLNRVIRLLISDVSIDDFVNKYKKADKKKLSRKEKTSLLIKSVSDYLEKQGPSTLDEIAVYVGSKDRTTVSRFLTKHKDVFMPCYFERERLSVVGYSLVDKYRSGDVSVRGTRKKSLEVRFKIANYLETNGASEASVIAEHLGLKHNTVCSHLRRNPRMFKVVYSFLVYHHKGASKAFVWDLVEAEVES